MRLTLAIGLLLASALTVQAQSEGNVRKRAPVQQYATTAASYAQAPVTRARGYTYDQNNPWDGPRTCY